MFDLKYEEIKLSAATPKKPDIDHLNNLGFKSINYSFLVLNVLTSKPERFTYVESIVNISMSIARIFSKLYDKELKVLI